MDDKFSDVDPTRQSLSPNVPPSLCPNWWNAKPNSNMPLAISRLFLTSPHA